MNGTKSGKTNWPHCTRGRSWERRKADRLCHAWLLPELTKNTELRDSCPRFRFKPEMWQQISKEMSIPWRAAEAMHWQLGEQDMARRAGVVPFSLSSVALEMPAKGRRGSAASSRSRREAAARSQMIPLSSVPETEVPPEPETYPRLQEGDLQAHLEVYTPHAEAEGQAQSRPFPPVAEDVVSGATMAPSTATSSRPQSPSRAEPHRPPDPPQQDSPPFS